MTKPNKRTTIRDIANHVGLHFTTVGQALKDSPRINKETRAKVKKAAEELGYRPDPMLSSLMSYRTATQGHKEQGTLAWLNNFPDEHHFSKNIHVYTDYFNGATQRADELGYRVEDIWLGNPELSHSRASDILYARNVAGLLLPPQPSDHEVIELEWDKFRSVTFGYTLQKPQLIRVSTNQYLSAVTCYQKLHELGFKKIGYAVPDIIDSRVNFNFAAGYLASEVRLGKKRVTPFVGTYRKDCSKAFLKWFEKYQPDAFICGDKTYQEYLENSGFKIPNDVSIAYLAPTTHNGSQAGIDQKNELVGRVAVDTLVALIQRHQLGLASDLRTTLITGEWMDGRSVSEPQI